MIEIMMMIPHLIGMIDLNAIGDLIMKNGVFGGLFVWLLFDSKKDSKVREERLLDHIERQGEALDKVTDTIERVDIQLSRIESKVDKN